MLLITVASVAGFMSGNGNAVYSVSAKQTTASLPSLNKSASHHLNRDAEQPAVQTIKQGVVTTHVLHRGKHIADLYFDTILLGIFANAPPIFTVKYLHFFGAHYKGLMRQLLFPAHWFW